MAFQPAPGIAQISIQGRVDGQLTVNNRYFEISGGGIVVANLQVIVNEVHNWAITSLAPQLSEDWTYERTEGRDLSVVDGPVAAASFPTPGGVSGEAAPNNVAACVSLRTGMAGRSGRGRNYLPGIPNSAITLNTLDSTFMSNIITINLDMIGAGTFSAGWQWVVLSRYNAGVLRANGIGIPITSTVFSSPYVASMRSRAVGHGA